MAELRLTGTTEDGHALRLAAPDGTEHTLERTPFLRRLALDDVARPDAVPAAEPADGAAPASPAQADEPSAEAPAPEVPRPAPSPAQEPAAPVTAVAEQADVRAAATAEAQPLSPRDIQARIRAGASVEQVARESGNAFSRVRTYGYPVLAERGYIAQQARAVQVWVGGPDLYSGTVADGGPTTLGALAEHRVRELGTDPASLEWDAWRESGGVAWTVVARFPLPPRGRALTAEEPPARWSFRPAGGRLDPENAWARILSDAEAWDVFTAEEPLTREDDAAAPQQGGGEEASGGDAPAAVTPLGASPSSVGVDADLLEILRARRGRRVGQDAESPPAPPPRIAGGGAARAPRQDGAEADHTEQAETEPAAPGRAARLLRGLPSLREEVAKDGADGRPPVEADSPAAEAAPAVDAAGREDAVTPQAPGKTDAGKTVAGPSGADRTETGQAGTMQADAEPSDAPVAAPQEEEPARTARRERPAMPTPRPRARSAARRASVPSWDDIVFGKKSD